MRSLPSSRASATSRFSITMARQPLSRAVVSNSEIAWRRWPSRAVAGKLESASGIVPGRPRGFPEGSTTIAARCPALTSTARTRCPRSWPTRISELERGVTHDTALARRSVKWLDERSTDAPESAQLAA